MRIAWPAYSNEVVCQMQSASLVSIITIMDINGGARAIGSGDFTFYQAFGVTAYLFQADTSLAEAREEHREIVEAICRGDEEIAVALMRRHVSGARASIFCVLRLRRGVHEIMTKSG